MLTKPDAAPHDQGHLFPSVLPGGRGVLFTIAAGQVENAQVAVLDLKTGRLIPNEEKATGVGRVLRMICPPAPGAKDWEPSAYSPVTGLVYIPHANL